MLFASRKWICGISELRKVTYRTHLFSRLVISKTNIWAPIGIVHVRVMFFPRFLNLRSRGRWVICIIELPEGYRVKDVDLSSLRLNGIVAGECQ